MNFQILVLDLNKMAEIDAIELYVKGKYLKTENGIASAPTLVTGENNNEVLSTL